jgi:hypothetical protein
MSAGTISLGQIAERLSVLEVACNRCDRRGRLSTTHLLREHGNIPGPVLLERLSADCPQKQAMLRGQLADVCGIHNPQLPRLF